MLRAREAGHPVTIPAEATIADGIAVRRAGDRTLPLVAQVRRRARHRRRRGDRQRHPHPARAREDPGRRRRRSRPRRAAPAKRPTSTASRTAVLVCGGNIDVTLLSKIIERGLVKDGRWVRVRIHLTDRPGALHNLTRIIADQRANIVETSYDRAYYGVSLGDTVIDITLETRGAQHIEEIRAALTEAGYRHERIE